MQLIKTLLKIKSGMAVVANADGHELPTSNYPSFKIGVLGAIDLDLRTSEIGENNELIPYDFGELSSADSLYLALDGDWDHETQPILYTAENILVKQADDGTTHIIAALPNTATKPIIDILAKKENMILNAEITGYKASQGVTASIFSFSFKLKLCNRIFIGNEIPESVVNNPGYLTEAEVRALIDAATRSTTPGPKGDKGDPGTNGANGKSAYELALENGFQGSLEDYLRALKGEKGSSAFELAKNNGFDGTEAEWLESLKAEGLNFDAVGTIYEKSLYDTKEKGFKFAASLVNATANKTTVYIWTKLSDTTGDWSESLTIDFFGANDNQIAEVKPVVLTAPSENMAYFTFPCVLPNSVITAVAIDTDDGELLLPYYSEFGVRKILRKDNKWFVYFGSAVPKFETGRIYLSQLLTLEEVNVGEGDIVEIETRNMYFGYIVNDNLKSVKEITSQMITEAVAAGTLIEVTAATLAKTSLGIVPAGAFISVIVPESYSASKDDGFGNKTTFSENNGITGTGSNGAAIKLNDSNYKVYGEFKLNNAEVFIYVDK